VTNKPSAAGGAARKSTGKRVTKSGDSGKGSTRKSDIPNQAFQRNQTLAARRSRVTFTIA
jgi:hypothetical protein